MNISFKELRLRNFKNHRDLTVPLGAVTRITGQNGEGKSTIGEAITWALYGTDPLGNMLNKDLSPEPRNYEYDRVEVSLLLSVDGQQILFTRWIENGDTKYYINDVPVKATAYKDFVDSLIDKNLFLSLFSPGYFFSQKWEEQRALLLKNVQNPTAKEVLGHLPKPQADKLGELLKKSLLEDLDAKHRDNKTRKDRELIAARASAKTLQEQLDLAKPLTESELIELNKQLVDIDAKFKKQTDKREQDRENELLEQKLRSELERIKDRANAIASEHRLLGEQIRQIIDNPPNDICSVCQQPLIGEARELSILSATEKMADTTQQRAALGDTHKQLTKEYDAITIKLAEIPLPDHDPDEFRLLQETRQHIVDQIRSSESKERLAQSVNEAKAKEKETEASFKESVFILDAIKAYLAKEAEIMAEKVQGLFQTLTLQLFQENKGDGERKPYFEIHLNGKPYRKLSRGEQYTAGMELIEVLSKQYNVVAPIFLDNAESYTGAIRVMGQAIICRAVSGELFKITEG
ncbi:AAA family ATPase [Cohnella yongneupensis]|uniref:Nuclease SbcCD subunit C n=1 Tax=Cohnella yongneupensis TaxID=425006 RepID=A0ABW0QUD8_9BACL